MLLPEPTIKVITNAERRSTTWLINNGFTVLDEYFNAAFFKIRPIMEKHIEDEGACFVSTCFHAKMLIDGELSVPFVYIIDAVDAGIWHLEDYGLHSFFNALIVKKIRDEIDSFLSWRDNAKLIEIEKMVVYIADIEMWESYKAPHLIHLKYCGQ